MTSSLKMHVLERVNDYRIWRSELKPSGGRPLVGVVPTMGALHAGHGALMQQARTECDKVVVTVFVNPLQFGPKEDFAKYPLSFERDAEICREAGVDVIFHPAPEEIYPSALEATTKVVPPDRLVQRLCGLFRPGHFTGVTTVVMKLFGITQPTVAYFGEKDYQQLTLIKHMVQDLNFPTEIRAVPTVREADGLAMSSRNVYLDAGHRSLAPVLYKAITSVRDESLSGRTTLETALTRARQELSSTAIELQYLEACDADSLESLSTARKPMVVLVAAKLGEVRLIDNVVVR